VQQLLSAVWLSAAVAECSSGRVQQWLSGRVQQRLSAAVAEWCFCFPTVFIETLYSFVYLFYIVYQYKLPF